MPEERFGSAVRWATLMNWGQVGFTAIITFVIAALLGPEVYGTAVVALSFIGLVELFGAQGFLGAIVQAKEIRDEQLDTVFIIVMSVMTALGAVVFLGADVWAGFFKVDGLPPLLRTLSVVLLIKGLSLVQEAKLTREMRFKSLAIRTNLSVVSGGVVGIVLAVQGFGVWALVFQNLTKVSIELIVLWTASNWYPRPRFRPDFAASLLSFSLRYFPAILFNFIERTLHPLLIGMFFGATTVGLYRMASRMVELALNLVTKALWTVAFPYFSDAQDDPEKLRERLTESVRLAATFAFPAMMLLFIEAPHLSRIVGERWLLAAYPLRILCVMAMFKSLAIFAGPALFAVGKPQYFSFATGAQVACVFASGIVVGVLLQDGDTIPQLAWMAGTRTLSVGLVLTPLAFYFVRRVTGARLGALFMTAIPAVLASASAAAAIALARWQIPIEPSTRLAATSVAVVEGVLGAGVGLVLLLALDEKLRTSSRSVIRRLRKRVLTA